MRAARHQNWIVVAFVAGSAALGMRSSAHRPSPCSGGLCDVPMSVSLLEPCAVETFGGRTNAVDSNCVQLPK